jgi:hypothetical protein
MKTWVSNWLSPWLLFLFFIAPPITRAAVERPTALIPVGLMETNQIIGLTHWQVKKADLLCTVREVRGKNGPLPIRTLSFYSTTNRIPSQPVLVLQKTVNYVFFAMYPTRDVDGDFMTVWQGASGYHVELFHHAGKAISCVLESGCNLPPELAWSSHEEKTPVVLLTSTRGSNNPKDWGTRIYRWNGKEYALEKQVGYLTRHSGL